MGFYFFIGNNICLCDLLILYKESYKSVMLCGFWTRSCVFSVGILLIYHSLHTWVFSLIYS